jgi:hypothetical protein
MGMQKWKVEITLSVDDIWVADGFEATKERIEEHMLEILPQAYEHEFKVNAKVISAPDKKVIDKLQGYEK